jgi:hypothetical protein
MITSKTLRNQFARELWASRELRKTFTKNEYTAFRFGMESGIWAVQRALLQDVMK